MTDVRRDEVEDVVALRRALDHRWGGEGIRLFGDAYALADRLHAGERRRSGDPFITHPVAVARLVLDWGQPPLLVCCALLHDAVINHRQCVEDLLGAEGVEILDRAAPESFAPTMDARAATLAIADRLHNARTWRWAPRKAVARKAAETLASVVPAAAALGLADAALELHDRSVLELDRRTGWASVGLAQLDNTRLAAASRPTDLAAARLYRLAVGLVPLEDRRRYAEEWAGELAIEEGRAARTALAAGLALAAVRLRWGR